MNYIGVRRRSLPFRSIDDIIDFSRIVSVMTSRTWGCVCCVHGCVVLILYNLLIRSQCSVFTVDH